MADRRSPSSPLPSPRSARASGVSETGDPEFLDPALQEMVTLLPPEEGWVENILFLSCSVLPLTPQPVVTKTSKKEQFPFPPGLKRTRMAVNDAQPRHTVPLSFSQWASGSGPRDAMPSPAPPAQPWS